MIKIGLAQINPTVGDIAGNYAKITDYLAKAKQKKCDLVIFPELALVGYPPEDLLLKKHFIEENKKFLKKIANKVSGIAVLVGFVDKEKGSIYNSCALIQDKKIKGIYHKIILPNYGVFDEKRYFAAGACLDLYDFGNYKFNLFMC